MDTRTCIVIKVVNQHQQDYQHEYVRAKKPNSLVEIAGELRVQITIIKDTTGGINISRTTILVATMRKYPKSIWQSRSGRPIPREF
jgi:hypothetical protein